MMALLASSSFGATLWQNLNVGMTKAEVYTAQPGPHVEIFGEKFQIGYEFDEKGGLNKVTLICVSTNPEKVRPVFFQLRSALTVKHGDIIAKEDVEGTAQYIWRTKEGVLVQINARPPGKFLAAFLLRITYATGADISNEKI